jgi:hypothetical protein
VPLSEIVFHVSCTQHMNIVGYPIITNKVTPLKLSSAFA